jgi:predicted nucleic acid-binding protein
VNGDAALLVTGDEDLLSVKRFRTVELVTARELQERVKERGGWP